MIVFNIVTIIPGIWIIILVTIIMYLYLVVGSWDPVEYLVDAHLSQLWLCGVAENNDDYDDDKGVDDTYDDNKDDSDNDDDDGDDYKVIIILGIGHVGNN